jgi:O-antigen ligase
LIALAVSTATLPFSTFFCHAGVTVFMMLWIFEGFWQEKLQILKGSIVLQCIACLFFVQLVGILYSDFPLFGWSELGKKCLLFLVPVALATTSSSLSAKKIRILLTVFVVTCALAAIVCLARAGAQALDPTIGSKISYLNSAFSEARLISSTWLYFSYINLASAVNIHPAYLALYIAFSIIIVLFELVSNDELSTGKQAVLVLVAVFLCVFEIFLTTRIMIIALLLIVASGSVYLLVKNYKTKFALVGFALILVAITLLRVNPVSYYRNVQEISKSDFDIETNSVYKTSAEIRASLWWLAWKAYGSTNPIIGAGTGSVKAKIKEQSDQYRITNVLDSFDPHNQFLYILIENGIVGLLVFMACLFVTFIIGLIEKDYLFIGFCILCGAFFMTESALELQKGIAFISIMYSLLAFQRKSYQLHHLRLNRFSVRH